MNYDVHISRILLYSLAIAFVCARLLVPALKEAYLRFVYAYYKELLDSGKIKGYDKFNKIAQSIRAKEYKPFGCIKCMTFWCSIIVALITGLHLESFVVGVVGLFLGALLEGILMRYF